MDGWGPQKPQSRIGVCVLGFLFSLVVLTSSLFANDTYRLATDLGRRDTGDFALLQRSLAEQSFSSPEALLQYWQGVRPEFFTNYVLAYRSRSLQESSPLAPRALLFNVNADLVMTFNGDPGHRGFSVLEVMRFDHDKKAFEFYELSFQSGRAQLSEANPRKCLACHQSAKRGDVDPRPNWEPYNTWPGFYGSIDDDTDLRRSNPHTRKGFVASGDQLLLDEFDQESSWFAQFQYEVKAQHPRYQLLGATVDQYGKPNETLNGDLTNRLAVLNFQRVARLIRQETALLELVKWPLFAHVLCAGDFPVEKDIVDRLYGELGGGDYLRFLADQSAKPTYYAQEDSVAKGLKAGDPIVSPYYSLRTTDVINLLFASFGVNTDDWSMDFKTEGGRFAAFERFGVTNDPRPPWRQAILREFADDPDFRDLTCTQAKEKTQAFLQATQVFSAEREAFRAARPMAPEPPLMQRCIQCHVESPERDWGLIPHIPFDDPEALKSALSKTGYRRGTLMDEIVFRTGPHATEKEQMPRQGVPSAQQREDLLNYLRSLL